MIRFLVYILITLMLASCKEKDLQMVIAGKNYKYWLKLSDKSKSQTFFYFNRDGKWSIFIKPYRSSTMKKYNGGDAILVENWSIINDSILNLGGIGYTVTQVSDEMILIKNKYFKDTLIYIPSPPPIEKNNSD